jgi:O-glycosyl hydrolase
MKKRTLSSLAIIFVAFTLLLACNKIGDNQSPNILSLNYEVINFSPFLVEFTAQANDLEDPISYEWNFGDGTITSGGATISHTFELGAVYTVTLSVSDGVNDPVTQQVQVDADVEARSVDVDIRLDDVCQTMQGFGGFGAQNAWWSNGPFYDAAFVDLLIHDLGITILRDEIPFGFEPQNENDDPNDLDLSAFNVTNDIPGSDSNMSQHIPYLRALHEAGLEKLISTIWSPPIWMKHNDHRGNGTNNTTSAPEYTTNPDENTNQLQEQYYEELAEYCVAYIQLIKQEVGVDLYAISLQNEPRFSQFYASCVHSPESLRDLIKVVGRRFEEEGLTTKIFAPEDVQSMWHIRQYLDAILNDTQANEYVDIFAIHNYRTDGITASDEAPKNWQETYQKAQQGDKQVWMTETSGFDTNTLDGGLNLAKSMFNAIHYGNASAWVYWQMSESGNGGFLEDGQPNMLYHISKHFYRHIRPGMQRLAVANSDNELLTLAFRNPDDGKKVMVLVNIKNKIIDAAADSFFGDSSFTIYTTDKDKRHEQQTDSFEGSTITIAGRTVMTLVEE